MRALKSVAAVPPVAKAVLEIGEHQFPLHVGKMYLIGRKNAEINLNSDITLEDETVDSKHAIIDVCKDVVQIFDVNSSSGTFLNGHRLDAMHRVNIKEVGTLRFGNLEGNLKLLDIMESPNSSGFHEEPTASSSEITGLQNKSDHSFIMPAAISRQNVSCNILGTSLNDSSDSNRTADSFSIPETQHFKARTSINEKPRIDDESHSSNDNESFIPETQEFVVPNTKSKCYEADNEAVEANLPADIFDGETKDSADSQFRICTQMFNDDCFGEEIGGNDDGFLQSSIVIPRVQHDLVVLNQSGSVRNASKNDRKNEDLNNSDEAEMITLNWSTNTSSKCTTVNEERNDACTPDLFDLPDFAQEIAKQTKRPGASIGPSMSNDKTVTNTVFDLVETELFISTNACTIKSADEYVSTTTTAASVTNESKTQDKNNDFSSEKSYAFTDKPGASVASTLKNDSESVVSVPKKSGSLLYEPAILDGDDYDLMPTQVFPHAFAAAARQQHNDVSVPVYLTLSDKENMQPTVVMLTESEKLEKTQLFVCPAKTADSNHSKSTTTSRAEDENNDEISLAANKSAADTASTSKKNNINVELTKPATHSAEAAILCSDDDLMPTQIFPHAAACAPNILYSSHSQTSATTASSKNCFNSTLLSVDGHSKIKSAASLFDCIEKTPEKPSMQGNKSVEFKKPMLQNKTSLSSVTSSQPDEDVDLQMCTPQLIQEEFMQLREQTKHSINAAKQRSLFGENSDEEDVLELINAPQKQSNDFDKLIPHLKVEPATPTKKEENGNKIRSNFNTFKIELKVDNKAARSRSERHVARDQERSNHEETERKTSKKSKSEKEKEIKHVAEKVKTKSSDKNKINSGKDKEAPPPLKPPAKRKTRARSIVGEAGLEIVVTNNIKEIEKKNPIETKYSGKTSGGYKSSKLAGSSSSKEKESDDAPEVKRLTRLRSCSELCKASTAVASNEPKNSDETSTHKEKSSKRSSSRTSSKEIETERKQTRMRSCVDEDATRKDADKNFSYKEKEAVAPSVKRTRLRSVASTDLATVVIDLSEGEDTGKAKAVKKTIIEKQEEKKATETEKKKITRPRSTTESQESNSSSSTSARASILNERKRKLETENATKIKRLRSQTSVDESTSSTKSTGKIQVSMTMVDPELFQKLSENAGDIWTIAKDPIDSDVLIMDKGNRTFKFLIAMAKGIPIVTSKWLECLNRNKAMPVNNAKLFFEDAAFEKRHKFLLLKSLEMARNHKLFAGYDFLMTPNIMPQPHEMKAIIDCAGGTVHAEKPPPFKDNQKIYLISHTQDKQHWHKYRRFNNNIRIISSEGVMASVMRQQVKPLDSYLLG